MELTGDRKILIALFRAINLGIREQAAILALLKEDEVISLNEWAISLYEAEERLPEWTELTEEVARLVDLREARKKNS